MSAKKSKPVKNPIEKLITSAIAQSQKMKVKPENQHFQQELINRLTFDLEYLKKCNG